MRIEGARRGRRAWQATHTPQSSRVHPKHSPQRCRRSTDLDLSAASSPTVGDASGVTTSDTGAAATTTLLFWSIATPVAA